MITVDIQMRKGCVSTDIRKTRSNGFMELAACLFEVDFSCLVPWGCNEGAMEVHWRCRGDAMEVVWKWHRVPCECLL